MSKAVVQYCPSCGSKGHEIPRAGDGIVVWCGNCHTLWGIVYAGTDIAFGEASAPVDNLPYPPKS